MVLTMYVRLNFNGKKSLAASHFDSNDSLTKDEQCTIHQASHIHTRKALLFILLHRIIKIMD